MLRFGSLASGIEAASVAWKPLGMQSAFFSEIDPFCCSLLSHRHPDSPNLGDMNGITADVVRRCGRIDILVAGTPCQAFSVAGHRAGITDPRGQLALRAVQILEYTKPRWFVWENVPGVLNSWTGPSPPSDLADWQEWEATETSDFGQFVEAIVQLGYGVAWRILDAQYCGVPQRRRRVFLVGCLGDWRSAGEVLFEPEGVSRNTSKTRAKGERPRFASSLRTRDPGSGGQGTDWEQVVEVANTTPSHPGICAPDMTNYLPVTVSTLNAAMGKGVNGQDTGALITTHRAVRRLTPMECERLQGFEDGYTLVTHRGKPAADGPRYKAIGNSIAIPVLRWIGERILMVNKKIETR